MPDDTANGMRWNLLFLVHPARFQLPHDALLDLYSDERQGNAKDSAKENVSREVYEQIQTAEANERGSNHHTDPGFSEIQKNRSCRRKSPCRMCGRTGVA